MIEFALWSPHILPWEEYGPISWSGQGRWQYRMGRFKSHGVQWTDRNSEGGDLGPRQGIYSTSGNLLVLYWQNLRTWKTHDYCMHPIPPPLREFTAVILPYSSMILSLHVLIGDMCWLSWKCTGLHTTSCTYIDNNSLDFKPDDMIRWDSRFPKWNWIYFARGRDMDIYGQDRLLFSKYSFSLYHLTSLWGV